MRRGATILLTAILAAVVFTAGAARADGGPSPQAKATKKAAAPAKAGALPPRVATQATFACPQVLGNGAGSKLKFCDVLTGRNPAEGVVVTLPPHKGVLTLTFDLHNRHTYSEDLVKSGKGYAAYTATIGVLTPDGTLLTRAVVRSEFRTARDLLDRITGGAGPGGVKAVAPIGTERISVDVPEEVNQVSLLGEKLTVVTLNGTETFTAQQRPVAAVSNLNIDYQPPAPKPAAKAAAKKKAVKK